MPIVNSVVRRVAAGVGLASESITAYNTQRREKKTQTGTEENEGPQEDLLPDENEAEHNSAPAEELEAEWQLDEAQDEMTTGIIADGQRAPEEDEESHVDPDHLADLFLERYQSPPEYSPSGQPKLQYPVVIPQRRPKSRKRGFIRAYAPALEEFGINQATFIDFVETANGSCQGAAWLNAINLASIGTFFIPSSFAFAVSIMIQITTQMVISADGRRKSNNFFDKINEKFFRPRGLYCLVMTWKPESPSAIERFDLNSAISSATDGGGPGILKKMKRTFKSSDGTTYGGLPFPQSAPLIFPDLDELAAQGGDLEAKLKKSNSRREFVGDYWDRRSQAQFIKQNPNSDLNKVPSPQFTSRYADPNHPASSGSLVGFISGGHVTGQDIRQFREDSRRTRVQPRLGHPAPGPLGRLAAARAANAGEPSRRGFPRGVDEEDELMGSGSQGRRSGGRLAQRRAARRGGLSRGDMDDPQRALPIRSPVAAGVNKLLSSDVLYMMIVDLPSEEEMAVARERLA